MKRRVDDKTAVAEAVRLTDAEVDAILRSVLCSGINDPEGRCPGYKMKIDWLRARAKEKP